MDSFVEQSKASSYVDTSVSWGRVGGSEGESVISYSKKPKEGWFFIGVCVWLVAGLFRCSGTSMCFEEASGRSRVTCAWKRRAYSVP